MRALPISICVILLGAALAAEPAPPKFTKKPTAAKKGGKVEISFAVDRETDVAVYILDAKGKVVRHLVAGVLGKNPPKPLKPGLSQSIAWDGKADYGKPAAGGPFKVRASIGMKVRYDKVLIRDPQSFRGTKALGVGPDGTVFVVTQLGGAVGWSGEQMLSFNRDGTYRRMLMPFPSNLKKEEVEGFGVFELRGRPAPLVKNVQGMSFHPGSGGPRKTNIAVTPQGKILRLVGQGRHGSASIAMLDSRGACPEKYVGAPLLPAVPRATVNVRPFIAVSSDGKHAFVSGLRKSKYDKKSFAAVYRVKLPERSPAKPFFGKADATGKGKELLGGAPRGLAVDGKGHLLIADYANDRVVVVGEADGKYVGEFAVGKPDCLGVDPKTGAVYVTRIAGKGQVELVKYSGWKAPKAVAKATLKSNGNAMYPWVMAVDASGKKPVVWAGGDYWGLLRIEDLGTKFGELKDVSNRNNGDSSFLDISVDRFRNEVYTRCGYQSGIFWYRFNEQTEKLEKVKVGPFSGASGAMIVPAPDGTIYGLSYAYHLLKFGRDGKPQTWAEGFERYPQKTKTSRGKTETLRPLKHGIFLPVSMTHMTHTLGVRHDGHIFVMRSLYPRSRPPKRLDEFLPSGKPARKTPIIWKVSDGAVGPKFDAAGNIYIAEIVRPKDAPYPPEFEKVFGKKIELNKTRPRAGGLQDNAANMYGSIVKFTPKGGTVHFPETDRSVKGKPYDGELQLDPSLKTLDAAYYTGSKFKPVKITGAEWIAPGYSHVDVRGCNCETTRFDVDGFGRVWYPDMNLFQVRVVDTNGNPLTRFGGYGNAESMGSDSPVVDAETGRLRPPKKGEKSPFAQPEIAFSWLVGVGVTDKYVYTGDSQNRRMLRLKMTYAAEETCAVQ